jgi:transposase
MANQLKVANVLSIQALHAQGWSQRRIARELGIHRDTVARHLAEAAQSGTSAEAPEDSKPAKAPTGSAGDNDGSKPAKAPPGSRSRCVVFVSAHHGHG